MLTRDADETRAAARRTSAFAITRAFASIPRRVARGRHTRAAARGCGGDPRVVDRRIGSCPVGGRDRFDRPDRRCPRDGRVQERGPRGSHGQTRSRRREGFQYGHSRGPYCILAGARRIPEWRARPISIPPHGPPVLAARGRPGAGGGPGAASGAARGQRSSRPGATRRGVCAPARRGRARPALRVGDLSLPLGFVSSSSAEGSVGT